VEQQIQVEDGTYSCSVLSSPDEIRSLKPFVRRSLTQNDILFDPDFFLSSVSSGWEPRVVAVRNHTELAGLVYTKERSIFGYRLGVVYADLTWGSVTFGDSVQQENTFRMAMEKLLASPGTRGIRLRILRGSPESAAVHKLIASRNLDVHFARVKDHADLGLPDTPSSCCRVLEARRGTTSVTIAAVLRLQVISIWNLSHWMSFVRQPCI